MNRTLCLLPTLLLLACSDSGDGGDTTPDGGDTPCVPTTCAAQGLDCGELADGCGQTLMCGGPCVLELEMVTVDAGDHAIGSPDSEPGREDRETQATVTLTQAFEILTHEVTQKQFTSIMGRNPAAQVNCGEECPVENVSFFEAAAFCNALSVQDGLPPCYSCEGEGEDVSCSPAPGGPYSCAGYRLPTAAEWEVAARAGTDTAVFAGAVEHTDRELCAEEAALESSAWYCNNAGDVAHPVKGKSANALGLYDTAGNVWEWVDEGWVDAPDRSAGQSDPWELWLPEADATQTPLTCKGGAFSSEPVFLRAALAIRTPAGTRNFALGFRVARSLP